MRASRTNQSWLCLQAQCMLPGAHLQWTLCTHELMTPSSVPQAWHLHRGSRLCSVATEEIKCSSQIELHCRQDCWPVGAQLYLTVCRPISRLPRSAQFARQPWPKGHPCGLSSLHVAVQIVTVEGWQATGDKRLEQAATHKGVEVLESSGHTCVEVAARKQWTVGGETVTPDAVILASSGIASDDSSGCILVVEVKQKADLKSVMQIRKAMKFLRCAHQRVRWSACSRMSPFCPHCCL